MPDKYRNQQRVRRLKALLQGRRRMLIVMQDYPDPDAIAAAAALKELANAISEVECSVSHGGFVGRAENQAMVKYLGINFRPFDQIDLSRFDVLAMVDTQPGTGNNSLPASLTPDIVIDHHPVRQATRRSPFTDVRSKYGATSTILHEYLQAAGITPSSSLSTALFYGVWSDTKDLGKKCAQADIDAFVTLHTFANIRVLREIQHGKVPKSYFQILADALENARVFGKAVVTGLGEIDNPDMTGEVADLLMRNQDSRWVLCYGFCDAKALFSIRTSDEASNAGGVALRMVAGKGTGGGHRGSAGGQIPFRDNTETEQRRIEAVLVRRFLRRVREGGKPGEKLVS